MNEISRSTRVPSERPAIPVSAEPATSHEQLSAYYLELERMLDRIERATTHYQLFGIERTATQEQVQLAYAQVTSLLYPSYVISAAVPAEMIWRMEKAFDNSTRAFKVLANFNRRREYDDLQPKSALKPSSPSPAANAKAKNGDVFDIKRATQQREVFTQYAKSSIADNRRRTERFKLRIPVRATGHDQKNGKWHEIGQTIDVSRTGINVRLNRRVKAGTVLYLTLPLPVKLRNHGYLDSIYNVYAIVRRVDPPKRGERFVGLEFIGEHPPAGYLENPSAIFRTTKWSGHERRRAPRREKRQMVWVEYLDENRRLLGREEAQTENVSPGGARISVRTAPPELDLIKVTAPALKFESLAAVRNRFLGGDGAERLCVQFVDKEWRS